jgi:preprotein translocase subunit Sec63
MTTCVYCLGLLAFAPLHSLTRMLFLYNYIKIMLRNAWKSTVGMRRWFASAYEILGVTNQSNMKEIKDAYFALAKRYHPDHNKEKVRALVGCCANVHTNPRRILRARAYSQSTHQQK